MHVNSHITHVNSHGGGGKACVLVLDLAVQGQTSLVLQKRNVGHGEKVKGGGMGKTRRRRGKRFKIGRCVYEKWEDSEEKKRIRKPESWVALVRCWYGRERKKKEDGT